jgi:hypothetical protein
MLVAASIALGGCASVRQTMSGWFGDDSAAETPTPAAAQQASTYYSAVEGLTIYAEASRSSKVVGHLALHQRVTRSQLENGYAYIAADKGGLSGWVDNAQLIWRLPAAAASPAPSAPPALQGAAPADATAPPAAEPTEIPPTAAPTPTATVAAQAAPPKPAPKMFDPY